MVEKILHSILNEEKFAFFDSIKQFVLENKESIEQTIKEYEKNINLSSSACKEIAKKYNFNLSFVAPDITINFLWQDVIAVFEEYPEYIVTSVVFKKLYDLPIYSFIFSQDNMRFIEYLLSKSCIKKVVKSQKKESFVESIISFFSSQEKQFLSEDKINNIDAEYDLKIDEMENEKRKLEDEMFKFSPFTEKLRKDFDKEIKRLFDKFYRDDKKLYAKIYYKALETKDDNKIKVSQKEYKQINILFIEKCYSLIKEYRNKLDIILKENNFVKEVLDYWHKDVRYKTRKDLLVKVKDRSQTYNQYGIDNLANELEKKIKEFKADKVKQFKEKLFGQFEKIKERIWKDFEAKYNKEEEEFLRELKRNKDWKLFLNKKTEVLDKQIEEIKKLTEQEAEAVSNILGKVSRALDQWVQINTKVQTPYATMESLEIDEDLYFICESRDFGSLIDYALTEKTI